MISNVDDCQWPPILTGLNAVLASLVGFLSVSERMNIDEIRKNQDKQLAILVRHHANNTPAFKERLLSQDLSIDDVSTISGLKKLATINKRVIQEQGDRFFCDAVPNVHKPVGKAQTSGSTGQPITVMRSGLTQLMWEAMAFRDHAWNGRNFGLRLCAIRANIFEDITQPVWGLPVSRLHATGPSMGMNVSSSIDHMMERIREFQPGILVVHAGVLMEMVMEWEKHGFDLTCLRHVNNIGDTVGDELRTRMRAVSGLEIEDNYSSSETGTIAIQCKEGGMFHTCEEGLFVEILNDNGNACLPGEIGRVVVTDLQNFASPVIRYDLGDYAEVGMGCSCGRTLPTLKRIVGRERNIFIRPDGSRFWPKAGMYDLPRIVPIKQWQIVQHDFDHVEYKLVTDEPITEEQMAEIRGMAPRFLGYSPRITVTGQTSPLPRSKNGKFEEAICLIKR